jgi:hypothetical protein
VNEYPRRWHEVLTEALWVHRTSKHGVTKVTPFELVYGQEVVLPVEVNLQTCRIVGQDNFSATEYIEGMMDTIDVMPKGRLKALQEVEREKMRVAKAYNERVKGKSFQIGELIWKTILPLGTRYNKFGKWSPSWEGPYMVSKVVHGNAYFIKTLEGQELPKALNGKY